MIGPPVLIIASFAGFAHSATTVALNGCRRQWGRRLLRLKGALLGAGQLDSPPAGR
jgi:hypothetical protein